jgi:hypothetical protein
MTVKKEEFWKRLKISIKNATPNKGKTFQLVMLESPDSVH